GSAPTTSNRVSVPSVNAATPSRADPTTWALVSSSPSPVKITADPAPGPIRRLATCGVSAAATALTVREYDANGATAPTAPHHGYYTITATLNASAKSSVPDPTSSPTWCQRRTAELCWTA